MRRGIITTADHLATLVETIRREADSIIVPGGAFKADGTPNPNLAIRCRWELELKTILRDPKFTILTGGRRGVQAYRRASNDTRATEAKLMKNFCVTQKGVASTYRLEPNAEESIGNIVFSSIRLLVDRSARPVIISQLWHLVEVEKALNHWFGSSDIRPICFPVESSEPYQALKEVQNPRKTPTVLPSHFPRLKPGGLVSNIAILRDAIACLFEFPELIGDKPTGRAFYTTFGHDLNRVLKTVLPSVVQHLVVKRTL